MLQRQFVVPCVALLSPVNHAVYVLTCIVRETDILAFLGQKLRHLLRRPIPNVRLVQLLVVLQDALRTELQHERVFNLARFRQFLTGNHFVRLDVLRGTPMRHPYVHREKSVFALLLNARFECCHIICVPIGLPKTHHFAVKTAVSS